MTSSSSSSVFSFPNETREAIVHFLPIDYRVRLARKHREFRELDRKVPYVIEKLDTSVYDVSFEVRVDGVTIEAIRTDGVTHMKATINGELAMEAKVTSVGGKAMKELAGDVLHFLLERPGTRVKVWQLENCLSFWPDYTHVVKAMNGGFADVPNGLACRPQLLKFHHEGGLTIEILLSIIETVKSQERKTGTIVQVEFTEQTELTCQVAHMKLNSRRLNTKRALVPLKTLHFPFKIPYLCGVTFLQCLMVPMDHAELTLHWIPLGSHIKSAILLMHVVEKGALEASPKGWTTVKEKGKRKKMMF